MPPRAEGLHGLGLNDDGITVGKVPVRGTGLRVGMQGGGVALIMSPAKARRVAKDWRRPEAVAAELDWIADALEEAADEIDATPHDEQMRMVDQAWATIAAKGTAQ
ncbi:hypothetical protein [Brevundimonas sp. BAL450]|uniref:hypothetical protein n=1 Tax=Brevundimonas sp. BAL450 TaxID=1708162 RepID=UPI001E40DF6C|nr:hypothetical protein [Brevundimonas sp. BAL450]